MTLMVVVPDDQDVAYQATIGPQGRVVIPAGLRKSLGWDEGTVLTFTNSSGEIAVTDQRAALRRFQAYGRGLVPKGIDVLDEFLADRRSQAHTESGDD